ncbi:hypothetical protein YC2023_121723 [Brassica napus]
MKLNCFPPYELRKQAVEVDTEEEQFVDPEVRPPGVKAAKAGKKKKSGREEELSQLQGVDACGKESRVHLVCSSCGKESRVLQEPRRKQAVEVDTEEEQFVDPEVRPPGVKAAKAGKKKKSGREEELSQLQGVDACGKESRVHLVCSSCGKESRVLQEPRVL